MPVPGVPVVPSDDKKQDHNNNDNNNNGGGPPREGEKGRDEQCNIVSDFLPFLPSIFLYTNQVFYQISRFTIFDRR